MKAKEWVEKLKNIPEGEQDRLGDVLKQYGEETAKLVLDRTKFSKPETRMLAAEGVIREQRAKFRSICAQFPGLNESLFDGIIEGAVPDYNKWVQEAQKKAESKTPEDDVSTYRQQRRGKYQKGVKNVQTS